MFRLNAALPIAQPLTMYCGPEEAQCQVMAVGFTRATGTPVAMTRKSSVEILRRSAPRRATRAPYRVGRHRRSAVAGGGGAAAGGVSLADAGAVASLGAHAGRAIRQSHGRHRCECTRLPGEQGGLARRNLPVPNCGADLLNPAYRGEIQMANPNSSGAADTGLATLVQLMGEEPAFA